MTLNDRQTLAQAVRSPTYWGGALLAIVNFLVALRVVPPSAREAVIAVVATLTPAVVTLALLWQPKRKAWTHEEKCRESARLIAEGKKPLEGYEHMLDPPPFRLPAPPREGE